MKVLPLWKCTCSMHTSSLMHMAAQLVLVVTSCVKVQGWPQYGCTVRIQVPAVSSEPVTNSKKAALSGEDCSPDKLSKPWESYHIAPTSVICYLVINKFVYVIPYTTTTWPLYEPSAMVSYRKSLWGVLADSKNKMFYIILYLWGEDLSCWIVGEISLGITSFDGS